MPNVDTRNGLKPIRYRNGSPYNGAHNLYFVPTAYGTAMFIGDVVTLKGSIGSAGVKVNGVDVEGMPEIVAFAASDALVGGVIVGFYPNPDGLSTPHKPASTGAIVMVADSADLIFEIQEGTGTPFTATMAGLNVDFSVGTGNATTGQSATVLDVGVTPVTTTLTARLLRLVPKVGNVIGSFARWEIRFVEHSDISATGI